MAVWKFILRGDEVRYGEKKRLKLTPNGCNEPFRDRYWCPRMEWFRREPCPFASKRECENYIKMCGCL